MSSSRKMRENLNPQTVARSPTVPVAGDLHTNWHRAVPTKGISSSEEKGGRLIFNLGGDNEKIAGYKSLCAHFSPGSGTHHDKPCFMAVYLGSGSTEPIQAKMYKDSVPSRIHLGPATEASRAPLRSALKRAKSVTVYERIDGTKGQLLLDLSTAEAPHVPVLRPKLRKPLNNKKKSDPKNTKLAPRAAVSAPASRLASRHRASTTAFWSQVNEDGPAAQAGERKRKLPSRFSDVDNEWELDGFAEEPVCKRLRSISTTTKNKNNNKNSTDAQEINGLDLLYQVLVALEEGSGMQID